MILVTGGTGMVGSHLLYHLCTKEDGVRAIYRNEHKKALTKKIFSYYTDNSDKLFNKIDWVKADILDVPALEIAFQGVSYVYHCAANLSFLKKNYDQSKAVNVTGTANIVNFCLSNNIKKLCHVSSVATIGEFNKGKLIDEETKWLTENNKHNITQLPSIMLKWKSGEVRKKA